MQLYPAINACVQGARGAVAELSTNQRRPVGRVIPKPSAHSKECLGNVRCRPSLTPNRDGIDPSDRDIGAGRGKNYPLTSVRWLSPRALSSPKLKSRETKAALTWRRILAMLGVGGDRQKRPPQPHFLQRGRRGNGPDARRFCCQAILGTFGHCQREPQPRQVGQECPFGCCQPLLISARLAGGHVSSKRS